MRSIYKLVLLLTLFFSSSCQSPLNTAGKGEQTAIPNAKVEGCYLENYSDPKTSEYILPFKKGLLIKVSQGNCGSYSTHRPKCRAKSVNGKLIDCGDLRYSYDFDLSVGEKIIATRVGQVTDLVESFSSTSTGSEETNYVVIRHDDESISVYLHLSQDGVLVKVGDIVSQGQLIAVSGNSGYTAGHPHLHYHVLTPPFNQCGNGFFSGCKTIPITFKNSEPLDKPLIEGRTYEALK